MKVLHAWNGLARETRPLALAIGFFDGVHRGHRRLLAQARAQADRQSGACWALTFEPHPARLLHPESAPPLLTPLPRKLELLAACGLDGCVVMPFNTITARMEPEAFVAGLQQHAPSLTQVLVGRNWRFGHDRRGTVPLLARLLRPHGITVTAQRPARNGGQPVSSTRIRQALRQGNLTAATAMLGRPYSIDGHVTGGERLGRQLGYPTANLAPEGDVLPPYGIYAARGDINGQSQDGVVSYGLRPTFHQGPDTPAVVEMHFFTPQPELYGQPLRIHFIRHLRDERQFASREALIAQIATDVRDARKALRRHTSPPPLSSV